MWCDMDLPTKPLMSPLTDNDRDTLQRIISRKLSHHVDHIERCEKCGIDMSAHKQVHDLQLAHAQALMDQFFPQTINPMQMRE